jgi:Rps23 Pro-64 3,4-dihydroxylase Tpa1-like proline 4-hydroxylase
MFFVDILCLFYFLYFNTDSDDESGGELEDYDD